MLERNIEAAVCDYAKTKGFLVYKFTSPQRAAVPDRMFVTPKGVVFFIEFKATGKQPTAAQLREHSRLRGHKVVVEYINDVDIGKGFIDGMGLRVDC